MESSHITLLGMTPEELLQVTTALDLPPRTARQIARWLYVKHVATLDEMTEQAFDDQCTGANPRYPLMSEIKEMYLKAYYGK